jgi:hypothetical protein
MARLNDNLAFPKGGRDNYGIKPLDAQPVVGQLVLDRNYGRTCAVLASTLTRALVAVQMKHDGRYQLRWRPLRDLGVCYSQSFTRAADIAARAMLKVGGPSLRFREQFTSHVSSFNATRSVVHLRWMRALES